MNTEIKPAARRKQPIEVGIEQRRQREIVRQMEDESYTIVLKVDCAARLFNSLDPTPFRERDLDPDAERFIVEWAQEAPRSARLEIVVQLPVQESAAESAAAICEAIRHNFGDRAAQSRRELRELLREGRRELIVGIPALALSIVFSQLIINAMGSDTLGKVLSESLLIFGWVANWRPLESSFMIGGLSPSNAASIGDWRQPT
ncbi:hypothetical protein [Rhizobium lentis]|uniref:hypothetical protein n=1 Tax=Rhizobium lentis TaxID=1138194 RepID=UPI0021809D09|nr:hypothetical protein [Rhizobium lentis]